MATSQPEINSRLATITNQLEQDLRAIILDAARAAAPVVESDLLTDAEILVSMGENAAEASINGATGAIHIMGQTPSVTELLAIAKAASMLPGVAGGLLNPHAASDAKTAEQDAKASQAADKAVTEAKAAIPPTSA